MYRYHRAFIEASNEYLIKKDELVENIKEPKEYFIKQDELLENVIDYFTEKYNKNRSDGTNGEMKRFQGHDKLLKKKEKIEKMKKDFDHSEIKDKWEFRSFRETSSQELENNGKLNKRKLNEFQFVIDQIQNAELKFEIMKNHLYNLDDEKSYFYALQKHIFDKWNNRRFSSNNKIKLILPACYFGHLKILEWLLGNQHDVIDKNERKETGLHIGNVLSTLIKILFFESINFIQIFCNDSPIYVNKKKSFCLLFKKKT